MAHAHQLGLGQLVHTVAEHPDGARVGFKQPQHQLEDGGFSRAAGAQENLGVAGAHRKGHVAQDHLLVEGKVHLVEQHHGGVRLSKLDGQAEFGEALVSH